MKEKINEALVMLIKNIADLFKIKSLVTLAMTYIMILLVTKKIEVPSEVLALFSTGYGAVMAYFFNHKSTEVK